MSQRTVGILIFPEVEVLDFCGPFEVFSVCRLNAVKRREEPSPFQVVLIAETIEAVRATGGLRLLPDHTLEDCPKLDILLVPGGYGTRPLLNNTRLLNWLNERAARVELLTSVCTGSLLLAQVGLLDGKRATTHWMALDLLEKVSPATTVVRDEHVVTEGKFITSAGISAGIELALGVVARYHGEAIAMETARYMEYSYNPSNHRRS